MTFTEHRFSKRFPPIKCAIFVMHEPTIVSETEVTQAILHRATAAALVLPDGRTWIGVSLCSPQDQFVKKMGKAKAIGRAYQKATSSQYGECDYALFNMSDTEELRGISNRSIEAKKREMGLL